MTPIRAWKTSGRRLGALAAVAAGALTACDFGSTGPPLSELSPDGVLSVTTRTASDPLDIDTTGYRIVIDTLVDLAVGTDTTVDVTVRGGIRDVALDSIQENCSVVGDNPVKAEISLYGVNAPVVFEVTCAFLGGSIRVVTATTGSEPDPDGYTVTLDGADSMAVAVSGETTYPAARVGPHAVELTGLDGSCVTADNPRAVDVVFGAEAEVRFDVVCEPPPGLLLEDRRAYSPALKLPAKSASTPGHPPA